MSVLTLAEAKTHLNLSSTANDVELQAFVDRAEAAIVQRTGPLVATAQTARVHAGPGGLPLPVYPVLSLTSVTPVGGSALTVSDLYASAAGVVTYSTGGALTCGLYDVTWSAGWGANAAAVPADLKLAVLELVRHFWGPQRGGTQRPGSAPSDTASNTLPGSAYTFPFRVEQLLEPYLMADF